MILPCMVLTVVGLLGFLVPPDSGEVSLFLMVIADKLPPNSDSLSMIGS